MILIYEGVHDLREIRFDNKGDANLLIGTEVVTVVS